METIAPLVSRSQKQIFGVLLTPDVLGGEVPAVRKKTAGVGYTRNWVVWGIVSWSYVGDVKPGGSSYSATLGYNDSLPKCNLRVLR